MPVEDGEWPEAALTAPDSTQDATSPLQDGPSVTAPDLDLEPHPGGAEDESVGEGTETLPEFDIRCRQDFDGLLYLGRLTHEFVWMGHKFVIRTLTTGETLEIGLLQRPYVDSLADVKAYQAGVVAACVLTVDGKPMPGPITNEPTDTGLRNRFEYVLQNWFPPILNVVYEEYLLLEERVDRVMEAMGNQSR